VARRTKIVATVGPASESPSVLDELIAAGVDVFRLNLSHGTLDEHLDRLADIRAAADRAGRPVGVLADLPGPKIRCAAFPDGGVTLVDGAVVVVVPGTGDGSGESGADRIEIDYPTLLDDVHTGDRIRLGDGGINLRVTASPGDGPGAAAPAGALLAVVEAGGHTQGRPGAHLPSERMRVATPTQEDLEFAVAMVAAGVDFVAVSFVRRAEDLRAVREALGAAPAMVVAKIETAAAIGHLDAIVAASDAVMVARGDLGIECPLEDVPHLQKRIVRRCVEAGVPVITATQMLESMISAPAPTRAEVSDVANAVFDGTDAVMLSGETAVGADPALVVTTMSRIAERAEAEASYDQWASRLGRAQRRELAAADDAERITMAITHAAQQAAADAGAAAVLCCTRSGRTARAMARFRPLARLVGLSPDPVTVRALTLSWGVEPLVVDVYATTDELVWFAVERALRAGIVQHGEVVAVLAGAPDGSTGAATDVLRVVRVR
jgi:pyruvate kinase